MLVLRVDFCEKEENKKELEKIRKKKSEMSARQREEIRKERNSGIRQGERFWEVEIKEQSAFLKSNALKILLEKSGEDENLF